MALENPKRGPHSRRPSPHKKWCCKRIHVKQSAFWFLLVDSETGELNKGVTAASVFLLLDADIDDFQGAVHLKNSCILTGIDASQLVVYMNKAAFNRRNSAAGEETEQP